MADTIKISVVLITYNQTLSDIMTTLQSVLRQDFDSFEIIISDDCSTLFPQKEIDCEFERVGFEHVQILTNETNQGIVRNMLCGIRAARGEIVKVISPGDAFFNSNTLKDIWEYYSGSDVQIGFGNVVAFFKNPDGSIHPQDFHAPMTPELYREHDYFDQALYAQIVQTDWIPGCSLFYRREFILKYLERLSEQYGVMHSEDLTVPLITLDRLRIGYLDKRILWYELGTGISSSGGGSTRSRMYRDHRSFFDSLQQRYPQNRTVQKAARRFKLREFIALKTPFYGIAKNMKEQSYLKESTTAPPLPKDSFLRQCMSAATNQSDSLADDSDL